MSASTSADGVPFRIGGQRVGWIRPDMRDALLESPGPRADADAITLTDPAALPLIAGALSEQGYYRWRGEAFDVRAHRDGPVLSQLDRGAIPSFGVLALGAHLNGLVRGRDGTLVWVARRSMDKLLDPGKLDHIAAGGVPAGLSPYETLIKEAGEEAGIPPALAAQARPTATLAYRMRRPEGLRRDHLVCYDLDLPADFTPVATDGEVAGFELWPTARVMEAVRDTDDFKFNVNLALIDLFLRLGLIPGAEATMLRHALDAMSAD